MAFRRDRLPLDTESMAKLSSQLTILADAMDCSSPEMRRGAAQFIALSLGLDSSNKKARILLGQYADGRHSPLNDSEKVNGSRSRILRLMEWLESSEAGHEAQELAKCLKDVLAISDPKDPRSEAWLTQGEQGAWKTWIPDLVSYSAPKNNGDSGDGNGIKPEPTGGPTHHGKLEILLTKASVGVPLWQPKDNSEPTQWVQKLALLQMNAGRFAEERANDPFTIIVGDSSESGQFDQMLSVIKQNLFKQHGSLPKGCWVKISSPDFEKSITSNKRQSISAAAAVLVNAALTGHAPDATIIGSLDASGNLKLPTGFWQQLNSLSNGKGSRLILPTDAGEYLTSILALENPQFFFDHEVLLASNIQELFELSAEKPNEALANASSQFQQIRAKGLGQPLGQYLTNSFVRRRLAELSQGSSYHYSAKMLALQGAGNRPAFVKREVLVSELLRSIEPLRWLTKHSYEVFTNSEINLIGVTFESCRTQIERLSRYADTTNRPLVDKTLEMVNLMRALERAAKTRPDPFWEEGLSSSQQAALTAFKKSHEAVMLLLQPVPGS